MTGTYTDAVSPNYRCKLHQTSHLDIS